MKKFALKIVLMLAIVVGLSNYGLYLMTGQLPLARLELPDFTAPDLSAANPLKDKTEKAWKWVDENGVTHYSTEAPAQQHLAQEIEVDPNTNLIQSIPVLKEKETKESSETTSITPVEGPIYDPKNIQQLMENAKKVEQVLQERHERQEEILNDL